MSGRRRIRRYLSHELFWLFVVCVCAVGVFVYRAGPEQIRLFAGHEEALFVGDVMLARGVEELMDAYGTAYPFARAGDLLSEYDVVIGNFEGSIPRVHRSTPSMDFIFSVDSVAIPALSRAGFTGMSLANNHSYDYGVDGYQNTLTVLSDEEISVGGHPYTLSKDDVFTFLLGGVSVAVIPINETFGTPDNKVFEDTMAYAKEVSDMQIIFIHWGEEYRLKANENQRLRARMFIDSGADAVIGHHPHVVQDIEVYRGAPIFYSLGNYVFDQYWDRSVQEGLGVSISFQDERVHYRLIPFTSVDLASAPRPMNRIERTQFLLDLAKRSESSITEEIRKGEIVEPLDVLASFPLSTIMGR